MQSENPASAGFFVALVVVVWLRGDGSVFVAASWEADG
jgi:hypothetical protein